MKTKTCLLFCIIVAGLAITRDRQILHARGASEPKLTVHISHKPDGDRKKHGVSFWHTNDFSTSGVPNTIEWNGEKEFTLILPKIDGWVWTTDGKTNEDTSLFDTNATVVIDSAGRRLKITVTVLPQNETNTLYHIAVLRDKKEKKEKTGGPGPKAPTFYYYYDMMEAMLPWDDISSRNHR